MAKQTATPKRNSILAQNRPHCEQFSVFLTLWVAEAVSFKNALVDVTGAGWRCTDSVVHVASRVETRATVLALDADGG